jgi:predicted RNA binding protein YcfA (HicA-like mRNA interferase family)
MGRYDKLLLQILCGTSDANIPFDDLRFLLGRLGFTERVRGSHHIFRREGVEARVTLQRSGAQAKAYQVRQVRDVIVRHKLGGVDDV